MRLSTICSLIDGEKKEEPYVCLDAKYLRSKTVGNIVTLSFSPKAAAMWVKFVLNVSEIILIYYDFK